MPLREIASKLMRAGFLPGILGGLLAFAVSNLWFHCCAAQLIPGMPEGNWMPDFFAYLQIDVYAGAGSGYAGAMTGRNLATLRGAADDRARALPMAYAFALGLGTPLLVNVLLLFISSI